MMNQSVGVLVVTGIVALGAATLASATDPTPDASKPATSMPAAQLVKGELLKIEGDFYVVKDPAGKEIRLQVSKDTLLDARLKAGDKIDAQVSPDGRVIMILKALE
ncbi:MAG: hypothetical protein HY581_02210 [Nitrospirae bacterium]|nr:hypothetical protein [Nitrospirota bacterium]